MAEELNIYQKLAKIRKNVEVIKKNKDGYNYTYVSEDEILAKISVWMDKLDLSLIPGVVGETMMVSPYHYVKTKATRDGKTFDQQVNEIIVNADMTYTWVNNTNPEEKVVVHWGLVGQQEDAAQAYGAGLTYAGRYFLLKYFNIATVDDDPDNFRKKQKEAEAVEDEPIAAEIIKRLDELVKDYLGKNKDKKDAVKEFFSKKVKNGDYLKVKSSADAAVLLDGFQKEFIKKGKD